MQGNVWEFVNDWYGQNYYSISPYENPTGPASGFIMPDGKPYRGMRGGNWYNGLNVGGISDGHSRVSNRNPSYYRGPQDPNHPYYHLGFRVVRNYADNATGLNQENLIGERPKLIIYPNPSSGNVKISFYADNLKGTTLRIYNTNGMLISALADNEPEQGLNSLTWDTRQVSPGIYIVVMQSEKQVVSDKIIVSN
jgi:hypothetical protein